MPHRFFSQIVTLCISGGALFFSNVSSAHSLEVFAKASASKNYSDRDSFTVSVTGATGLAVLLIPQVRVEGRYTLVSSLQNHINVATPTFQGTLNDIKTQTNIYSVGLDIDILSDKHTIQPFIFLGAGYIETLRSYYIAEDGNPTSTYAQSKDTGISTNVGAGFRIRIAKSVAFEVEAYGYGINIQKPNPLINLYANAGIRIYM